MPHNPNRFLLALFLSVFTSCCVLHAQTDTDSLYYALLNQNRMSLQEKVYLHIDNTCYYPGDTLWYKAYLLRADNLAPSPLSKILYVELISPEGYLIERQRIVCGPGAKSCGQFAISDTIYSGYYELRAYTRWQLNFNVSHRDYSKHNAQMFFNKQLAADYFREYEDLYSRVIPIYEKTAKAGDYAQKRIVKRQKRRLDKELTELRVHFFPEGGQIIEGLRNRIAFEATDAYGKPLDLTGKLADGTTLKTLADGRGTFVCSTSQQKAYFTYQGKDYTFDLPKAMTTGATLSYNPESQNIEVNSRNVELGPLSVCCRGQLVAFEKQAQSMKLDWDKLPTGVNEITVYDADMQPLAVRQIFVNHNDLQHAIDLQMQTQTLSIKAQASRQHTLKAYEPVKMTANLSDTGLKTVSISVRDTRNEEPTYDDGNILTDLLLAGDLRGFVAHPAYYFEADDAEHRERLDLLMMIQGWHKYTAITEFRYLPEVRFQFEGQVHKFSTFDKDEFDQASWNINNDANESSSNDKLVSTFTLDLVSGRIIPVNQDAKIEALMPKGLIGNGGDSEITTTDSETESDTPTLSSTAKSDDTPSVERTQNEYRDHKDKPFKKPLYVEAELEKDGEVAGVIVETDLDGHFSFNLPAYYDSGNLFVTAYEKKDSAKMCLTSTTDKYRMDGYACPDFYVRQEKFFPIYTLPYSWWQIHQPSQIDDFVDEGVSATDSLFADHVLDGVTVQAKRRRGIRSFDKNKPLLYRDFGALYNDMIDYGLHRGGYNPARVWDEAARFLFGNMGKPHEFIGIRATIEGHTFVKTYNADTFESWGVPMTLARLNTVTNPGRIWKTKIFTDYDLRNDDGKDENRALPDVVFELVPVPNAGLLPFRRDRRIRYEGFAYAEEFYSPDYSNSIPEEPSDYRRTLYWNPNATFDAEGNIEVSFFTGSRDCRVQVDACGVTDNGEIYNETKPFNNK